MVIDTSALLAILFAEPEARRFIHCIDADPKRLVSAMTMLEAAVVTRTRKGPAGVMELDLLLHGAQVDVVPFDAGQARVARSAYEKFGKGRHPAALNLGDCCSFSLARTTGEPLLFKGNDFPQTDIVPVIIDPPNG
jgi:ribonuclease VapC